MEGARLPLNGGRPSPEETRTPPERDRPPAAATVRTPFGAAPIALEGVDPTGSRTPVGQDLNRDAETRMRIEQGLVARVPPTALAPPVRGLRASPSFGGAGSTHPLGDKRFFRPLVGVGAQPFRAGANQCHRGSAAQWSRDPAALWRQRWRGRRQGRPLRDRRPRLAACPGILAVQPQRGCFTTDRASRSAPRDHGRMNDAALR